MRLFGKIETGFWRNPKVNRLSDHAKLLLAYLFSCPHGNGIGCFVLPQGYIAVDLGWDPEVVAERLSELLQNGFATVDEPTNLIRIIGWWGHNSIDNPNMAKYVVGAVKSLPNCQLKQEIVAGLNQIPNLGPKVKDILSKGFQDCSEVVSKGSRNKETETEKEKEKDKQTKKRGASAPAFAGANAPAGKVPVRERSVGSVSDRDLSECDDGQGCPF